MRFLYAGNFSQVRSTEGYVADALVSLGHDVRRVQEDEWSAGRMLLYVEEYVRKYGNGHVFLSSKCQLAGLPFRQMTVNPTPLVGFLNRVRDAGMRPALWVYDLMRAEFNMGRYQWARLCASACDRFVTTDSGLGFGDCVRQGYPGPTLEWEPYTHTPKVRPEYECDVAFLGEVYGPRKTWLAALRREFGPRFRHFNDGVHGDDLFDLCRSAKVVVGPPYPAFPGYWSNRLFLSTGYGATFACPEVEGMSAEGWQPYVHYYPLSRENFVEDLKNLLAGEGIMYRIKHDGQTFCQSYHTVKHRAQDLITLLGKP